jgi:hypothetical protein
MLLLLLVLRRKNALEHLLETGAEVSDELG